MDVSFDQLARRRAVIRGPERSMNNASSSRAKKGLLLCSFNGWSFGGG